MFMFCKSFWANADLLETKINMNKLAGLKLDENLTARMGFEGPISHVSIWLSFWKFTYLFCYCTIDIVRKGFLG